MTTNDTQFILLKENSIKKQIVVMSEREFETQPFDQLSQIKKLSLFNLHIYYYFEDFD